MINITLFKNTFSASTDNYEVKGITVPKIKFIATINNMKLCFSDYEYDVHSYILTIDAENFEIKQRVYMAKVKGDTVQSYYQRAAKKFEKQYLKTNIKLQIFQ